MPTETPCYCLVEREIPYHSMWQLFWLVITLGRLRPTPKHIVTFHKCIEDVEIHLLTYRWVRSKVILFWVAEVMDGDPPFDPSPEDFESLQAEGEMATLYDDER